MRQADNANAQLIPAQVNPSEYAQSFLDLESQDEHQYVPDFLSQI